MCKHEIFHTTNSIEVESADIKSRWILDISMYGIIIFCFSGLVLNSVKEVSRFPSLGVHILFCFFRVRVKDQQQCLFCQFTSVIFSGLVLNEEEIRRRLARGNHNTVK